MEAGRSETHDGRTEKTREEDHGAVMQGMQDDKEAKTESKAYSWRKQPPPAKDEL